MMIFFMSKVLPEKGDIEEYVYEGGDMFHGVVYLRNKAGDEIIGKEDGIR